MLNPKSKYPCQQLSGRLTVTLIGDLLLIDDGDKVILDAYERRALLRYLKELDESADEFKRLRQFLQIEEQ